MYGFRSIFTINRAPLFLRGLSTNGSLVDLTVDGEGIALLSLKSQPVNSLNVKLLQAVNKNLEQLQNDQCKGLVITSALPKVFSAGLDLKVLNNPDPTQLRLLWWNLQELCLKLYGSAYTTTVAINGHTAAGACVLSLLCDYRVMVNDPKAKIGMNDTAVGIVPRPWVCEVFNRVMGYRQAEIALTASAMYTAEEALKVNLIDEIAPDKEKAIEKCKQFLRRYDKLPLKVTSETKRNLRAGVLRFVEEKREEDIELFVRGTMDQYTQTQISMYVEELKQKKNKKEQK